METNLLSMLPEIPLFNGLSGEFMEKVASLMQVHRFEARALVAGEDDIAQSLFVIVDGRCSITANMGTDRSPYVIAEVGPGDCVGEMSLVDMQRRGADIRALTPVTLYSLSNADFLTLYEWNAECYTLLLSNIAREISRRLRISNSKHIQHARNLNRPTDD